jgi:hypothetical protein
MGKIREKLRFVRFFPDISACSYFNALKKYSDEKVYDPGDR